MSKQTQIMEFVQSNPSTTWTTAELCEQTKCSLPTVLKFIKENSHLFEKRGRGSYRIVSPDTALARSAGEATTFTTASAIELNASDVVEETVTNTFPKPTFDW